MAGYYCSESSSYLFQVSQKFFLLQRLKDYFQYFASLSHSGFYSDSNQQLILISSSFSQELIYKEFCRLYLLRNLKYFFPIPNYLSSNLMKIKVFKMSQGQNRIQNFRIQILNLNLFSFLSFSLNRYYSLPLNSMISSDQLIRLIYQNQQYLLERLVILFRICQLYLDQNQNFQNYFHLIFYLLIQNHHQIIVPIFFNYQLG